MMSLSTNFTDARLVEVSTMPSMRVLISRMPCGQAYNAFSRLLCVRSCKTCSGIAAFSTFIFRLGSFLSYSNCICRENSSYACKRSFFCSCGTTTTAEASRAMALRRFPPSKSAIPGERSRDAFHKKRIRILMAFPRFLWISSPEWPPSRPVTENLRGAESFGTARVFS